MSRVGRFVLIGVGMLLLGVALQRPVAEGILGLAGRARAGERLEAAAALAAVAGRLGATGASVELAATRLEQGELLAAAELLDRLEIEGLASPGLAGRAHSLAATLDWRRDEIASGLEHAQRAVELAVARGDARLEVEALLVRGEIEYAGLGQRQEAYASLDRALELAARAGAPGLEAEALAAYGRLDWWHRRDPESSVDRYLAPALEHYRRLEDRRGEASTLGQIGLVHLSSGDYHLAERSFSDAARLQAELGDQVGLADTYAYLGALFVGLMRSKQGYEHYRRSLELAERIGYLRSQRNTERLLADYHMRRGEYDRAIALLEALAEPRPHHSPTQRRRLLAALANCYLHKGDVETALERYDQALEEARRSGGSFYIRTALMKGHAYMQLGDLESAAGLLHEIERLAQEERDWGSLVFIRLAQADLHDYAGRAEVAIDHLAAAAEIEAATYGTSQTHFYRSQYEQVYARLHSLLFAAGRKGVPEASAEAARLLFRFVEQMRYRSLRSLLVRRQQTGAAEEGPEVRSARAEIERLGAGLGSAGDPRMRRRVAQAYARYEDALLRRQLDPQSYRLARRVRPVEPEEVVAGLDRRTVVVEYLFAGERVFALVVSGAGLEALPLPIERTQLSSKVRLLRALVFGAGESGPAGAADASGSPGSRGSPVLPESEDEWWPVALGLDRALVEPLRRAGLLDGVERLGIVPAAFLNELPFALLARPRGDGVRLLIEDHALFFAPSVSVLVQQQRRPAAVAPPVLVAFGVGEHAASGLGPIPFAPREAARLATLLGGELRLDAAATEAAFKGLAPGAGYLHLATHAVSEPQLPLLSRLELRAGDGEDGRLTVGEILALELGAELVALSACRTGLSHSLTGNDLADGHRTGFVEAFLHAGARSVLASLLPVSDASTLELMTAFYGGVATQGKAEALAAAQRAMLRGEPELRHPRHWAPFLLVGAPD